MGSNSSKEFPAELSAQQIELIKSKTSMNSNEIFAWYSQFLDLTHGKDLTRDQFVKYYKNIISKNYSGNPDQFCHLAFNAFDLNDSNHIDFSEMIVGLTVLTSGTKEERLRWMFRFFDQNKDGFIDGDEMKAAIKAILKMRNDDTHDERLEEICKSIHQNMTNNEKINEHEFVNGALSNEIYIDIICPNDI